MKMKIVFIILTVLPFLLLLLLLHSFLNRSYIQKVQKNYGNQKYIYWTGGYDSTFCVCYYLFIKKQSVMPIYINGNIDNDEKHPLGTAKRKSYVQERETMKKLYILINNKLSDPSFKNVTLFEPIIIDKNKILLSQGVKESMKQLYNLGYMRRPICQYAFLAEHSLQLKKNISVSVEYAPHKSKMFETVFPHLVTVVSDNHDEGKQLVETNKINFGSKTSQEAKTKCLNIFKYLDFPIIRFSKNEMFQIGKQHKFSEILKQSWTCWYPTMNSHGKYQPCNKCIMCKQRNEEIPELSFERERERERKRKELDDDNEYNVVL